MGRFRHLGTGVVVDVREGKDLGSDWEPIVDEKPVEVQEKKPAPRRSSARKSEK